jgi:transposase
MFFRRKRSFTGQVLQLLESYRSAEGRPRQRVVVSLGAAALAEADQVAVARAVEAHYYKVAEPELLSASLGSAAQKWVDQIIKRVDRAGRWKPWSVPQAATAGSAASKLDGVLVEEVSHTHTTILGPLLVGWRVWEKLGLPAYLEQLGFSQAQARAAAVSVLNRLAGPISENALGSWVESSSLPDLWAGQWHGGGRDRFYRVSDKLLEHQAQLERYLRQRQGQMLGLERSLLLYDLTNSFFEGEALGNPKARRGQSKEKRHDRPQIVMGVVFDQEGFELTHRVFAGNQSDGKSLVEMVTQLRAAARTEGELPAQPKPLVILDGGLAKRSNLKLLRAEGFNYLVNDSRRGRGVYRQEFKAAAGFVKLEGREGKPEVWVRVMADPHPPEPEEEASPKTGNPQEQQKVEEPWTEQVVLCRSQERKKKELAIRSQAETRFLEALERLAQRVRKGQLKAVDKIHRAVGRLTQKSPRIQRFYEVKVRPASPEEVAQSGSGSELRVEWSRKDETYQADEEVLGCYVLRTDRGNLSAPALWELYMTLSKAEDGFKALKSDLGLRPNRHQKELRVEAHVFITVLAYQVWRHILYQLEQAGDHRTWQTIRQILQTHCYTTMLLPTEDGRVCRIRKAGIPEECQKQIYRTLGVDWTRLPVQRMLVEKNSAPTL